MNLVEAEKGATGRSVVAGLGYPNGRVEQSQQPTGWHASAINPDGSANQFRSNVTQVDTAGKSQKA